MTNLVFQPATKSQSKLRLALCGPAGSGKTYTALTLAGAIGERIAVIDTENGSSNKYADQFKFSVLALEQYSIETYIRAIQAAVQNGFDVVIIDSLSHAWAGSGGALSMVDSIARKYSYNTAAAWSEITPLHNQLIDSILRCPIHLIATMRTKTEWDFSQKENGKIKPFKIGTKPVQRDGFEYEFDVVGEIDVNHDLFITKTRYASLDGLVVQKPTAALGENIRQWLDDGEAEPDQDSEEFKLALKNFHNLGFEVYADGWEQICLKGVQKISGGLWSNPDRLQLSQLKTLHNGVKSVWLERNHAEQEEVRF